MSGYMRKKRQLKSEINVVPYIDVMLVLLIIFMVTSPFVTQGVEVDLPQTQESESAASMADGAEASFIIVEVDKTGTLGVSVNDDEFKRGLSLAQVISMVKEERQKSPDAPIAVGGDRSTPYENIILVLDGLNQSGIDKVGLLTDIKE